MLRATAIPTPDVRRPIDHHQQPAMLGQFREHVAQGGLRRWPVHLPAARASSATARWVSRSHVDAAEDLDTVGGT
jgi:hypothetical protein